MNFFKSFKQHLFSVSNQNFQNYALELFRFQASNNAVYNTYLKYLNVNINKVKEVNQIPFLPIDFFKNKKIISGKWDTSVIFESSGTTGQVTSKHYVYDVNWYKKVTEKIFRQFYGDLHHYYFFALLPSYLERSNASLVFMMDHFIKKSRTDLSGFYLKNHDNLLVNIKKAMESGRKVFLIGVTFALLDLAERYPADLNKAIVMETGGMKGRRKELVRKEVHSILKNKLNIDQVHSEYGMTELMSQAYSKSEGIYQAPPWMKVYIRDINDPFDCNITSRSGGVNVIDLANWHSCAFIQTNDLGRIVADDGSFEILGRMDNADIRGCNLMIV